MKHAIRREVAKKRDAHHAANGDSHRAAIEKLFFALPEFASAKCVLLYASKGSEVETRGIIGRALSLGKTVALPATVHGEKRLLLYRIGSVGELSLGEFGIMEPRRQANAEVRPSDVDLAVVPGMSFDRRGHRIGYGMGYYDTLLKGIRGLKVGLAYSVQIVEHVPDEPHDCAVDLIVSENEVIDCRKAGGMAGGMGANRLGTPGVAGGKGRRRLRVAVLASGRGSDFQSIIDAANEGEIDVEIAGLISDNPQAAAIGRAMENGIPAFVIGAKDRDGLDSGIKERLDLLSPDLVVLAGYMKVIKSRELLEAYRGRMINIHPSLLPKYPGAHAQKDAFEAGEKVSGYTIHFVDASLDGGPIIHQEEVDISGCKSWEEAAARILEREHRGLPMVVGRFASGKYGISDGKVTYKS